MIMDTQTIQNHYIFSIESISQTLVAPVVLPNAEPKQKFGW